MGTIVFIFVLSVLVIVHEYGHMATAKALGVRVERFAIGFGPKLLTWRYQETEYAMCLIPLGGYVKMAGDERTQCQGAKNEFFSQSPGHRSLIVLAGPIVNYVFAFLCFCFVFMVGYPALGTRIGGVDVNFPAGQSDLLQAGDRIITIDSMPVRSWEDVQSYVSQSRKGSFDFVIERDHAQLAVLVESLQKQTRNIFGQQVQIRQIGIYAQDDLVLLRYGFFESVIKAARKLFDITTTTYKALYFMATGAMSAKEGVTGPIGIFFIITKAAELGLSYVLYIMGVISASLAIFNLLPLPVLDGGHVLLFGIEKIRGKSLPVKTEEAIYKVGLSLIVCLAVFIFYNDFLRFGIFEKIFHLKSRFGF